MASPLISPEDKEQGHVHEVYSQIANHFSDTRYNPWPKIAQFLSSLPPGSLVADIGCGNGKYLGVNNDIIVLGSDICPELVTIARGRGHEVMICDCLSTPYRSDIFDAVISIAVVHHLSTEERRVTALREMSRLLRPGGQLLVYVWAMEQNKRKFTEQDVMIPWHLQPHYTTTSTVLSLGEEESKSKRRREKKKRKQKKTKIKYDDITSSTATSEHHITNNDCTTTDDVSSLPSLIDSIHLSDNTGIVSSPSATPDSTPSLIDTDSIDSTSLLTPDDDHTPNSTPSFTHLHQYGFKTYYRYYHVFIEGELIELCGQVKTLNVTSSWYDHENWCIEAVKIAI